MANSAVHTWKDEKERTLNFMLECGRCATKHTSKISEQEIEDGTVLQQQYGCDCGGMFAIRFLVADWNTVAIVVNEVHPDGTAHQWHVSPQGGLEELVSKSFATVQGEPNTSSDTVLVMPEYVPPKPAKPTKGKRSLLLDK